jgi:hypothetical protein
MNITDLGCNCHYTLIIVIYILNLYELFANNQQIAGDLALHSIIYLKIHEKSNNLTIIFNYFFISLQGFLNAEFY